MRSLVLVLPAVVVLGCGTHRPTPPGACTASPAAIERAASGATTLGDGTRLSDCVADARSDADVQDVAAAFTTAADELAARARQGAGAARGLGFLIGAGERGAGRNDIAAELAHRLAGDELPLHAAAPAMDGAVARGLAQGLRRG
jgi:hypothetical protein